MTRTLPIKFFAVFMLLLIAVSATPLLARALPIRRVPLNDEIALLSSSDAQAVKRVSQELYRDFKCEMGVLIIRTTRGENAGDFAERVFNHWGLGQAGVDNGMLILFAIDDRRVEIKPGIRYRSHFNESFCTSLLTRFVVPEMRANRPGSGVMAAAREVAAEIRRCEEALGNAGSGNYSQRPAEAPAQNSADHNSSTNNTSQRVNSSQQSTAAQNASKTAPVKSAPLTGNAYSRGLKSLIAGTAGAKPMLRLAFFAMIALTIGFGIFYFINAFNHGSLLMPCWMFVLLMLLLAAVTIGLGTLSADPLMNNLDATASGTGGVSLLVLLGLAGHICPRCNKYMSVNNRTLHYATYTSTGLGERTEHCSNCNHHRVSTYTISRKTRSSSSSSSRSSSSGGGRSSGGGGGASW